uniref:Putative ml domain salivary peptide n=1 Tax=Corethrella appendiculata TaxID=1370023 RepID=U5EUS6_9DIPT
MNYFISFGFICLLVIKLVIGLQFEDCGSTVGKFTSIEITDCDTSKSSCVLHRNTNVTISLDFQVDEEISEVKSVVHGVIVGMEVPFKLPNNNACVDSGIECPLKKDQQYKYSATLPVLKMYPKVKLTVKWELQVGNSNGTDIVCVYIPAEIK